MCPGFLHFELESSQGSVVDGGEVRNDKIDFHFATALELFFGSKTE